MKQKFLQALTRFVQFFFPLFFLLILMRVAEWLYLRSVHTLPAFAWRTELAGLVTDFFLYGSLLLLMLIPFMLLSLWKRWAATLLFILILLPALLIQAALVNYFGITLVPLDHVIFSYSFGEMIMIAGSSSEISLLQILLFPALAALFLLLVWLSKKIPIPGWLTVLFILYLGVSIPLFRSLRTMPTEFTNEMDYYLKVNKLAYFTETCIHHLVTGTPGIKGQLEIDAAAKRYHLVTGTPGIKGQLEIDAAAKRYQMANTQFQYFGLRYPFLHKENTPDNLGAFFNLGQQPPNLVFIIGESLSAFFCGDESYFGSFTPFLDSLIQHSLYWNNCLATSERTFNVLPALFASLPPGRGDFTFNVTTIPYHFSLIRSLSENGYFCSFFYGGNPSFNGMKNFLRRQNTGYIQESFGPDYQRPAVNHPDFGWGFYDEDLFRRSFELIDSMGHSPRLDIYLTLTLHSPFVSPDPEKYLKVISAHADISSSNAKILATVLYTDNAMREFFNHYRKRADFANTIFIITGDHALPELNPSLVSPIAQYHVPLVIYSPMLKQPAQFRSVVSHLDVTPSLMTLLHNQYGLRVPPVAQWLGEGLDTTRAFHAGRTIYFIRNNKDINQYLKNDRYLSYDRLFRVGDGMKFFPIEDKNAQQAVDTELHDFNLMNDYIIAANAMVPVGAYFEGGLTAREIGTFPGEENFPGDHPYTGEFYSFIKEMHFDRNYRSLRCEITFDLLFREDDPEKHPLVVIDLFDSTRSRFGWEGLSLMTGEGLSPVSGKWNTLKMYHPLDMSVTANTHAGYIKVYLWNRGKKPIHVKNVQIKLTGYHQ